MIGEFSRHASVDIIPDANTNQLSCTNPLGVVPKCVKVSTSDRSLWGIMSFSATQTTGVGAYRKSDEASYCNAYLPDSGLTTVGKYWFTANTIDIMRAATGNVKWLAGVTYAVHIYA